MFKKLYEKHRQRKENQDFLEGLNNLQSGVASSIVSSLFIDVLNLKFHTTELRNEINPDIKILKHVNGVINYFNNDEEELIKATKKAVRAMFSLDELVDIYHHPLRMEKDKSTYKKCLTYFERVYREDAIDANAIMFMMLEYEVKGSKTEKSKDVD